jgi:drug/metabolite transporter (DMT)-like permease
MPSDAVLGASLALGCAVCWAISPLCFSSASKSIGAHNLNQLRLAIATAVLLAMTGVYAFIFGLSVLTITPAQAGWLCVSGVIGLLLGDYFLFNAYLHIGPRQTMQINTLSPVFSVGIAWLWLAEKLSPNAMLGVVTVLSAVAFIVFTEARPQDESAPRKMNWVGFTYAVLGALCTALGATAGRSAFANGPPLDGLLATTIRVGLPTIILWAVCIATGGAARFTLLRDPYARSRTLWGVLFGPLLAMICYINALKFTGAGIVSTIAAMSPLIMIPIIAQKYRTRIRISALVGTAVAIAGVALICLKK